MFLSTMVQDIPGAFVGVVQLGLATARGLRRTGRRVLKCRRLPLVVVLALVFTRAPTTPAATLDVGGNGPFRSIQPAVNAAQPGDTVRVATGTYIESVFIRKSLAILGGFDAAFATQDPTVNPTRILARATSEAANLSRPTNAWLVSGVTIVAPPAGQLLVQGQTIRRIEAVFPADEAWQIDLDNDEGITTGDVWLVQPRDVVFHIADEAASATDRRAFEPLRVHLDGLIIAGGRADRSEGAATDSGGGIYLDCSNRATFVLSRCELTYNSAKQDGGGFYGEVTDLVECRLTSNILTHNSCSGSTASAGGGLSIRLARGSEFICANNRIAENRSSGDAGGLDVEADSGCYVKIAANVITSNVAQANAGGFAARLGVLSLLESVGNRIETNRAVEDSCGGGYLELWDDSRAWLTGDRVWSNRAGFTCGGLDVWAEDESQCELSEGLVSNNEAEVCGGLHIEAQSASAIALSNLDVTSNGATLRETGGLAGRARQDSQIEMTTVTVVGNHAARDCGGLDLIAERSSRITLVGCEVARNTAGEECGAGRIAGLDNSLAGLVKCQLTDNRANGGANGVGSFAFTDSSHLRLEGCDFIGNRSVGGSAVGSFNLTQGSSGELADCQFHDNATSESRGIGSVQVVEESSFTVRRCDFLQNEAVLGWCGALHVEGYFGSSLNFAETVFEDNQSSGSFAALYVYTDDHTSVTVAGCHFVRNRTYGDSYGACAIKAQHDSPVVIHSSTFEENLSGGHHAGLYIAATDRSPVAVSDCRMHHNVALYGNSAALTVFAEKQSTVSLVATHCWANRAYGEAGAVWIVTYDECPLAVEDCDWYDNIAWYEETEPVILRETTSPLSIRDPKFVGQVVNLSYGNPQSAIRNRQSNRRAEIGDLVTQGSFTWAISDVRSDGTSASVRLVARASLPINPGRALLRRIGGEAGAFVIDQRGGGSCFLTRCRVWGNYAGCEYGAGRLTVLSSPELAVRECTFSENIAGRDGGALGVALAYVDRVNFERNAFLDNKAGVRENVVTGGFCGGLDLSGNNLGLLFSGNSIRGNRAFQCGTSGGSWGGGFLWLGEVSLLEFSQNEIRGNQADADVGGVELSCRDFSSAAARDNLIADNRAGRDFGGLAVSAGLLSPVMLESNEFRSNSALECGGGLALRPSEGSESYVVARNQFARNTARVGGAVFVMGTTALENNVIVGNMDDRAGAVAVVATSATLSNETLADNQGAAVAAFGGTIPDHRLRELLLSAIHESFVLAQRETTSALTALAPAALRITNSILWGNDQAILSVGNATIEVTYSDLASSGSASSLTSRFSPPTSFLWPGVGNISADPRFIAPPRNYRLAAGSPAIDAGTSVSVPAIDFLGARRPLDGDGDGRPAWDLGAYEMPPMPKKVRGKR